MMGILRRMCLLQAIYVLFFMGESSLCHPISSCSNETGHSFHPTIQIFMSPGAEPASDNAGPETTGARLDEMAEAIAVLQAQQEELTAKVASLLSSATPPTDCYDALQAGHTTDGVYRIKPHNSPETFQVYCDMTTDGGGWTVFQRRENGTVDFFREWEDYRNGFGYLTGEFWLGNHYLHLLTHQPNQTFQRLRVDLWSFDGESAYAEYDRFLVDEDFNYRLKVGNYRGTAGDSLTLHGDHAFTTVDEATGINCAVDRQGAWWYYRWYDACSDSNLNSIYQVDGVVAATHKGIVWTSWKGDNVSLRKTTMKLRPHM